MRKTLQKKRDGVSTDDEVLTVTMTGLLRTNNGTSSKDIEYEHTFKMLNKNVKDGITAIFKYQIADRDFPIMYPGFSALLTHHIKSVVCENNPSLVLDNPDLLDRAGLLDYIDDYDLPVQAELYKDIYALRQACKDCVEDPEGFRANQNELRYKKELKGELTLGTSLDELNPLPTGPVSLDVARPTASPGVMEDHPNLRPSAADNIPRELVEQARRDAEAKLKQEMLDAENARAVEAERLAQENAQLKLQLEELAAANAKAASEAKVEVPASDTKDKSKNKNKNDKSADSDASKV